MAQVLRGSEIAETVRGSVEFARIGTGPVILQLTPSRPGYLRTPLATGATPEQAADAIASLLDVLEIDKVCVMGTSGGGPTALQFVLRHPQRVWALVLQSAVTQQFVEPRLIGCIVFSRSGKWLVDFGAWGVHLLARYWPTLLVRTLLNASDDLDPGKAKERRLYVQQHREQLAFFCQVAASGLPLSVRHGYLE